MKRSQLLPPFLVVMFCLLGAGGIFAFDEWKSGINWKEPGVVTPGSTPQAAPSDAIILFDGTNVKARDNTQNWIFQAGYGIAGSAAKPKQKFGDCQLHLEFATPAKVVGNGQGRGNNGVLLMERYELQILDSYENPTYFDGQCGAIYKQHPPLVNACRKPGEWQTYDVFFTAPRFNPDGTLKSPATITVSQNGVLIQNHFELQGATSWDKAPLYSKHELRESLQLGYHGNPVRFRNIWIRDLLPLETPAGS